MTGLMVSRHWQLKIRDIIPQRFFGKLELAIESVSIVVVKMIKLRIFFEFLTDMLGFWKNIVPND
jgi:hypothetical protein